MSPLTPRHRWRGFRPLKLLAGDEEHVLPLLSHAFSGLDGLASSLAEFESKTHFHIDLSVEYLLTLDAVVVDLAQTLPEPLDEEFAKASRKPEVIAALGALESQISNYYAALQNADQVLKDGISSETLNAIIEQAEKLRSLNCAGRSLTQLKTVYEMSR